MIDCCHLSPVTCHLSPFTWNLSPVTCHLLPGTCHLTTTLCCFSCYESLVILSDANEGGFDQIPFFFKEECPVLIYRLTYGFKKNNK